MEVQRRRAASVPASDRQTFSFDVPVVDGALRDEELALAVQSLRRSDPFSMFPNDFLIHILASFTKANWDCGEPIFSEGEDASTVFVLTRGACDITKDGHKLETLRAGVCLGAVGVTKGAQRSTSAVVVSPAGATTWMLDRLQYKLFLHEHNQRLRRQVLQGQDQPTSNETTVATEEDTASDKSRRLSPRLRGYKTLKWIKSRLPEEKAGRVFVSLQEDDAGGDRFSDAIRYLFQEFDQNNDERIDWVELKAVFLALEKALPESMARKVRAKRRELTARHRRDTVQLSFYDFKLLMQGFDVKSKTKGFHTLQAEKRATQDMGTALDFADFLRSFAMRKKIAAILLPASERRKRSNTKKNVLVQRKKLSATHFREALQVASETADSAKPSRSKLVSLLRSSEEDSADWKHWQDAATFVTKRRSVSRQETRQRPHRRQQFRKQNAISIARELLGTKYR